jgi:hypothetical protein
MIMVLPPNQQQLLPYSYPAASAVDMKGAESVVVENGSRSLKHHHHHTSSVIDKIPDEAESLTVLVGGVKFLEHPITAFVRLEEVSVRMQPPMQDTSESLFLIQRALCSP